MQNPHQAQSFVALDKMGDKACLINLGDPENLLTYFPSTQDCSFYGHGQFFEDGETFVTTETSPKRGGKLVIRKTSTLEILKEIRLPNYFPHDCIFIPGTSQMLVALTGSPLDPSHIMHVPSQLLQVDLENGNLIERYSVDQVGFLFGHLAMDSHGFYVASLSTSALSKSRNGLIAVGEVGKELRIVDIKDQDDMRFDAEVLSVIIDEKRNRVISVSPHGRILTIWDRAKNDFIAMIDLPSPSGVCINSKGNYVTTQGNGFIYEVSAESFEAKLLTKPTFVQYSAHISAIQSIN